MTYARAGHPYPVLIRKGEPLKQLEIRGSLLGIFEQAVYKQQSIQLQKGDKIILYSDGCDPFVGIFDDKKGFLFTEEFKKASELPIDEMFDKFRTFTQQQHADLEEIDDMTLVGFEIL
jgi:sigma-B regulation protein RsbU (phosphoserine phosphatase)